MIKAIKQEGIHDCSGCMFELEPVSNCVVLMDTRQDLEPCLDGYIYVETNEKD